MDVALFGQFMYYKSRDSIRFALLKMGIISAPEFILAESTLNAISSDSEPLAPPPDILPPEAKKTKNVVPLASGGLLLLLSLSTVLFYLLSSDTEGEVEHRHARKLLQVCHAPVVIGFWRQLIGNFFGWASAVLYLSSRTPQIFKNCMRSSVEGLSIQLFFCAVMGNVTYAAGILLHPINSGWWDYILPKIPWLVGSLGTLCFDFTIFCQFGFYAYVYPRLKKRGGETNPFEPLDESNDPEGDADDIVLPAALP